MCLLSLKEDSFVYIVVFDVFFCQDEVLVWFDRMYEVGCVFDVVIYSIMLDVYGKMGKCDEVVVLYDNLRKLGWKLDKVMYGIMVRFFGRVGYMKVVVFIFQEMKDFGV